MVEAVVEFDYDAVNGDELTLRKGDIIKDINMMEGGWWEGVLHTERGMFPDNFVKIIEKTSSTQKSTAASTASSSTTPSLSSSSSMKSHSQGPVANGDVSLGSQEMGDDAKVKKREGGSKKRKMRAKVTFSYSPQNEDELELIVNDTVEVIDQPEEGWWEGIIKGKHGLFPSNFVTIVDEDDAAEHKTETVPSSGGTTPMEEEKPVKKIKSSGIGHGNIFAQGMPQLRKTPSGDKDVRTQAKPESHPFALKRMSLRKKEHEEKKDEEKKEDKNTTPATETKGLFKVKVIYDYEPKNADELQLKKGEIVTVTDKNAGDSGWWKGEVNGKVGVFPDNFTEEIHEEKTKKKNMPAPVPARPVSGPSRPGSMEVKGGSSQKPGVTKQPSQDNIKTAPKESHVNGSRHLPPGAKQVLPPPTAGRPQLFNKPTALTKPQSTSKPHDVKETPKDSTDSGKSEPKETTFDNIKPNSEKLTHMNLSRPKATPNRRPPSTFGAPPASSSSNNTPLSPLISPPPTSTSPSPITSVDGPTSTPHPSSHHDDNEPKQPPPWSRDIKKSLRRPPVALPTQEKSTENGSVPPGRPKASPAQSGSTTTTNTTTAPATDTSSGAPPRPSGGVTKTTASSNSAAPSKDAATSAEVQDLKKEIKALHETIASIKSDFKKEVKKLMTEVDDEKKHRMMMQVELERIKKIVMERD
ncbi:SH3 domain-containing kinase-binding protein 1-like isoform X4 [Lytechinus variegatus]|uniref:SH3 domain-containing kinase-binding protein 1-like isoform X4 n=1 Tax=Lytechinus variegatus TaxID=7654 RepID=UPI001BB1F588|nr:SH3 domain-containing kinase-binding protein 1-like isoform X4 [Lytechinus variegatus]